MKKCIEEGCDNPMHARGYCLKHYSKHYRAGDFKKNDEVANNDENAYICQKDTVCVREGCDLMLNNVEDGLIGRIIKWLRTMLGLS